MRFGYDREREREREWSTQIEKRRLIIIITTITIIIILSSSSSQFFFVSCLFSYVFFVSCVLKYTFRWITLMLQPNRRRVDWLVVVESMVLSTEPVTFRRTVQCCCRCLPSACHYVAAITSRNPCVFFAFVSPTLQTAKILNDYEHTIRRDHQTSTTRWCV